MAAIDLNNDRGRGEIQPALIHSADDATNIVTLNADHAYNLRHLGIDDTGAESLDPIHVAIDDEPGTLEEGDPDDYPVDYTERKNKFVLLFGHVVTIGPGAVNINHRADSDGTVLFQVEPFPSSHGIR